MSVSTTVQHVEGLTIESKAHPQHHCPACAAGKQHHDPFPASSRASRPLELVHTDLSGPAHGFRDLAEGATCILARAGMSISWWAEAAHTSNYIYNCFPHHALGCTPFEL